MIPETSFQEVTGPLKQCHFHIDSNVGKNFVQLFYILVNETRLPLSTLSRHNRSLDTCCLQMPSLCGKELRMCL